MTVRELREELYLFDDHDKVCVSVTKAQASRELNDFENEALFEIDRVDFYNSPPHSVKISLA